MTRRRMLRFSEVASVIPGPQQWGCRTKWPNVLVHGPVRGAYTAALLAAMLEPYDSYRF